MESYVSKANNLRAQRLNRTASFVGMLGVVVFFYGVIVYAPLMIIGFIIVIASLAMMFHADYIKNRRM